MSFKNFSSSQNTLNKEQATAKAAKTTIADQKPTTSKEAPVAAPPSS